MGYGWKSQRDYGARGCAAVSAFLRSRGHAVVDMQDDKHERRRDIDLLVDGKTVEVKTDSYTTGRMFLELTSDGRPGALYKSRAEVWAYWYPGLGKLYWLPLPALQWWLKVADTARYKLHRVPSYARNNDGTKREWYAEGYAIPVEDIKAGGVPMFEHTLTPEQADALLAAEAEAEAAEDEESEGAA